MSVVSMLSKQSNRGLCIVRVELRHIKVINEVNHLDFSRGSVLFTGLFFKGLFKLRLEKFSSCIIVKVNDHESVRVWFGFDNIFKDTFGQLRFSAPRISYHQRRIFVV